MVGKNRFGIHTNLVAMECFASVSGIYVLNLTVVVVDFDQRAWGKGKDMPSFAVCCFYISLLLQILGFFLYFTGFLPLSHISKYEGDSRSNTCQWHGRETNYLANETRPSQRAERKRLVFMVVDALREDFVFQGGQMPFLQSLINDKKTISFLAKSHPPTVTLPRVKAMVTGKAPGFIDVVLNLASTELREDNIISNLFSMDKIINFFGDETWLKLFPSCFMRHDGTTSFVVSDYTEVDDNVTRHLPYELSRTDWDILILHFLGLDHIGHFAGPMSPLIGPKLLEMDKIVQEIIEAIMKSNKEYDQDSLFVLTSDHGMNDAGSHGGASAPEILCPLVFTSPSMMNGKGEYFTRQLVSQLDIAPSIAAVFNADFPENSVGAVIVDLLKFLPIEARKDQIRRNICQLLKQSTSTGEKQLSNYCDVSQGRSQNHTVEFLAGVLKESSLHLQKQSSEYHIDRMNFGLLLISFSLIAASLSLTSHAYSPLDLWFLLLVLLHSLAITSTSYIEEEHQFWYFAITTSVLIMFLLDCPSSLRSLSLDSQTSSTDQLLSHSYAMLYFIFLLTFRVTKAWNQTGIKWLNEPDISSFLFLSSNGMLPISLIFSSLVLMFYICFWKAPKRVRVLAAIAFIFIFIHKVIAFVRSTRWPFSINGVVEARIVFVICLVLSCKSVLSDCLSAWNGWVSKPLPFKSCTDTPHVDDSVSGLKSEHIKTTGKIKEFVTDAASEIRDCYQEGCFYAFFLLFALLQRPHNIVWLCLVTILGSMLRYISCQRLRNRGMDVSLVILHYCMGKASFHAQGHSNSLASVDISAAFVGVHHYSPLLSGFFTSTTTYGAHVFWYFRLKQLTPESWAQSNENKWTIRFVYNAILSLESIVICFITYLNRYHLFIWTVFAPKFLFLVSFRLFMTIIILIF